MYYKVILLAIILLLGCGISSSNSQEKEPMAEKNQRFTLPMRGGNAPKVGQHPPQLQYSDQSPRPIYQYLHDWMFSTFPKVRKEPTKISVQSSIAMWLDEDEPVGHTDAFMPTPNSREFTHLHLDGSIHTVVDNEVEDEILAKKWGVRHMYYHRGVKEMLIYAPWDEEEIEVLKKIITKSYEYATGLTFKKD